MMVEIVVGATRHICGLLCGSLAQRKDKVGQDTRGATEGVGVAEVTQEEDMVEPINSVVSSQVNKKLVGSFVFPPDEISLTFILHILFIPNYIWGTNFMR